MNGSVKQIKDFLEKDRQTVIREKEKEIRVISFAEYLLKIERGEYVPRLAHQRIYDAIMKFGYEEISWKTNPRLAKLYCLEPDEVIWRFGLWAGALPEVGELVGIDPELNKIVEYFHAPTILPRNSEKRKQMLLLISAAGAAKDLIIDAIRRAMELSGPFWAIKDCPFHEEPLHLLRRRARSDERIRRLLEKNNIVAEGDICDWCRYRLKRGITDEHGVSVMKPYEIWDFPVELVEYSSREQIGLAEVDFTDETNYGPETLIGRLDIQQIHKGESETDVRVVNWDAAFPRGSRGLIEWKEVLLSPPSNLSIIQTSIQDKRVPSPIGGSNYWDGAHVGTSNWPKFMRYSQTQPQMMRRFHVVTIHYNLILDEEIRRLRQDMSEAFTPRGKFTEEPHALEVAAALGVMSRFAPKEPFNDAAGYYIRMLVRNGEDIEKPGARGILLTVSDVADTNDGLFEAITLREERKYLLEPVFFALVRRGLTSLLPQDIFEFFPYLISQTALCMNFDDKTVKHLHALASEIESRYRSTLVKELRPILVENFADDVQKLFTEYLSLCETWVEKQLSRQQNIEVDEERLNMLEGPAIKNPRGFRESVVKTAREKRDRGEPLVYTDFHKDLCNSLEAFVFSKLKDLGKTSADLDESRLEAVIKTLMERGYSREGAFRILNSL